MKRIGLLPTLDFDLFPYSKKRVKRECVPERNLDASARKVSRIWSREVSDKVFGNPALVEMILAFAGNNVHDLLNLVLAKKAFLHNLQHEHVIRAALNQEGRPRETIKGLLPLIRERKIWIPSPLRLLRLCNGRLCERCSTNKVRFGDNDSSRACGVLFCDSCFSQFQGLVSSIDQASFSFTQNTRVVSFALGSWTRFIYVPLFGSSFLNRSIWTEPIYDSNGDYLGPLVTQEHMHKMSHEHCGISPKQYLANLLIALDTMDPNKESAQKIVEECQLCLSIEDHDF